MQRNRVTDLRSELSQDFSRTPPLLPQPASHITNADFVMNDVFPSTCPRNTFTPTWPHTIPESL